MLYFCLSVWHIVDSQKAEFRKRDFRIDAALFKQSDWTIQKILTQKMKTLHDSPLKSFHIKIGIPKKRKILRCSANYFILVK